MSDSFLRLSKHVDASVRLFCFHHAGGMAAMFSRWPAGLPNDVDAVAVQLPGRAERYAEPAFRRMEPLVRYLADEIRPLLEIPFVFFGHSMGAKVAFALAHELRARAVAAPRAVYVAASAAPCLSAPTPGWAPSDDDLIAYLTAVGGTPQQVLADPAVMAVVLPPLRADLALAAAWSYSEPEPLSCSIHALVAEGDQGVTAARARLWERETKSAFTLTTFAGDHFFVRDEPAEVLSYLSRELRRHATVREATP
ncbi:thioesterase II family protein [Micromonospora noduli]|uniref:Dodecanoyl-[acyl-carrier-protein] hydrolase n=1 Tax=Micromonospora noduli TaxID=709876 RepID=A0ABX9D9T7_9ACTN|nr:alpha/beta fold hydrolase [Micromonospora noduli]KAB1928227.1 thioesterase [Micromonospora noduli]RAO07933.1 Dodecanoyl-[acyl-carrier-protein] hydrolase [Micromonospora noduli]RAO12512.1 Dodecanoyl-[acyl-carrier-protein] hydrolase [Micromonospora noduli]RAO25331.1 Dodecanoyl-[acyl-carrier-protein] hydrolase [Micromonospora noduli]RAO32703.1 Dodecanoyl-[acyl-carrier-protein] hydrolase [Micromonospora noduli]